MKKYLLIIALITILLSSCSTATFNKLYNRNLIVTKDAPTYYSCKDSIKGDEIGRLNVKIGDTLNGIGYYHNSWNGIYSYMINYNSNNYFINNPDVMTEDKYIIYIQPTTFKMPKEKDREVWSRAVSFVNKHTDMKIQTQTDLMIETYNPVGKSYAIGFQISKVYIDNDIEYTVNCVDNGLTGSNLDFAKKCAYYMRTGKEL